MKNCKRRGFTLIEMLIVVVIIGILAAALIPRLGSAKGKANDSQRNTAMSQIGTALGTYVLDYGYPDGVLHTTGVCATAVTGELTKGGLITLPKDPTNQNGTFFLQGPTCTGYAIFEVKKGLASGFAIVSIPESNTSANWVDTGGAAGPRNGGAKDMGQWKPCKSVDIENVTEVASEDGTCKATKASQLRKIVVY